MADSPLSLLNRNALASSLLKSIYADASPYQMGSRGHKRRTSGQRSGMGADYGAVYDTGGGGGSYGVRRVGTSSGRTAGSNRASFPQVGMNVVEGRAGMLSGGMRRESGSSTNSDEATVTGGGAGVSSRGGRSLYGSLDTSDRAGRGTPGGTAARAPGASAAASQWGRAMGDGASRGRLGSSGGLPPTPLLSAADGGGGGGGALGGGGGGGAAAAARAAVIRDGAHRRGEVHTGAVLRTRSYGSPAPAPVQHLPSIGMGGGLASVGGGAKSVALRPHALLHDPRKEPVVVSQCTAGARAGVFSIQGLKPGNPRWENQDNFVMEEALECSGGSGGGGGADAVRAFAVLDGHGESGHLVTRRCRERLPQLLAALGLDVSRACVAMHEDLASGAHVDCQCSGATCVVVTLARGVLMVANLGDSRCVLGRWDRAGGSRGAAANARLHAPRQVLAVPLTTDHKPDRPDERARIQAMGGQVGSRQLIVGSGPSGPIRIPMGPSRVWYSVRGETMGLAMSRSIGDVIAHAAGVSAEPEVVEHPLDAETDLFLILASDGIWDVMDVQQAVHIVAAAAIAGAPDWDPREAAATLAGTARKRWEGLSPMIDDITALVVKLQ